jgi:hypothetical protein
MRCQNRVIHISQCCFVVLSSVPRLWIVQTLKLRKDAQTIQVGLMVVLHYEAVTTTAVAEVVR